MHIYIDLHKYIHKFNGKWPEDESVKLAMKYFSKTAL